VNLHHQRVLASADRAVARGELGKIRLDLEAHGAAMTAAGVFLLGANAHCCRVRAAARMVCRRTATILWLSVHGISPRTR